MEDWRSVWPLEQGWSSIPASSFAVPASLKPHKPNARSMEKSSWSGNAASAATSPCSSASAPPTSVRSAIPSRARCKRCKRKGSCPNAMARRCLPSHSEPQSKASVLLVFLTRKLERSFRLVVECVVKRETFSCLKSRTSLMSEIDVKNDRFGRCVPGSSASASDRWLEDMR